MSASARADEPAPPLDTTTTPPATSREGRAAEATLRETLLLAKTDAAKRVIATAVEATRRALERAHGARSSGDEPHALLLDGLATEHAGTARDLQRAAEIEARAFDSAREASEIATKLERARALLEETQADRGRAKAELERVEAEAKVTAAAAAQAEQQRINGKRRGASR